MFLQYKYLVLDIRTKQVLQGMKCNLSGLNISFYSEVMTKINKANMYASIIQAGANTKSQHMQGVSRSESSAHAHESARSGS